jgi:hypothetical protein
VVEALTHLDSDGTSFVEVDDDTARMVGNGRVLEHLHQATHGGNAPASEAAGQRRFVLDAQHRLLGVYERSDDAWRPSVVMPEPVL